MAREHRHVVVQVRLTEKEYLVLRRNAAFTPHGTVAEALREALGRTPQPHGHTKDPTIFTEREYLEFIGQWPS